MTSPMSTSGRKVNTGHLGWSANNPGTGRATGGSRALARLAHPCAGTGSLPAQPTLTYPPALLAAPFRRELSPNKPRVSAWRSRGAEVRFVHTVRRCPGLTGPAMARGQHLPTTFSSVQASQMAGWHRLRRELHRRRPAATAAAIPTVGHSAAGSLDARRHRPPALSTLTTGL